MTNLFTPQKNMAVMFPQPPWHHLSVEQTLRHQEIVIRLPGHRGVSNPVPNTPTTLHSLLLDAGRPAGYAVASPAPAAPEPVATAAQVHAARVAPIPMAFTRHMGTPAFPQVADIRNTMFHDGGFGVLLAALAFTVLTFVRARKYDW